LYSAYKELEVSREQYKLAQNQVEQAKKKVAAGAAARIEIVRAQAGVSSRLEAVIISENALENRERDLRRIMNRPDLPLDDTDRIIPETLPHPLGLKLNDKKLIEYALANRMDLVQLEQQLAIDKLNIDYAENGKLPDLTFTGRYSLSGQDQAFSRSFNGLTRAPADEVFAGLTLSVPLGNEAAKARLHRARLYERLHNAQKDDLEQYIRQQVQQAVGDLATNWNRILAAEQGVEAAYRDYLVEQSQFQLGARTSTDVLYAAARLADAQLARIFALADYEIAQIKVARATGTLLGYDKIVLEPINIDL
jgi:outer membrane protein